MARYNAYVKVISGNCQTGTMDEKNGEPWDYEWGVDESTWNGWRIFPE